MKDFKVLELKYAVCGSLKDREIFGIFKFRDCAFAYRDKSFPNGEVIERMTETVDRTFWRNVETLDEIK